MRPAARLQAAIELLDEIIVAARDNGPAADKVARQFFAARRYAGSKDRRAVRDLVWEAIRRFGERPESGRSAFAGLASRNPEISALFDGSEYGPAELSPDEPVASGGTIPDWTLPLLNANIDETEQAALLERASLDIRVNSQKASMEEVMSELPVAEKLPASDNALRLPAGFPIDRHALMASGAIEIQDIGSQMIVGACQAKPGMTVIDLCAGAGGKTLALAADMGGQGRLIAADTNRKRLGQLLPRAKRAGVGEFIEQVLLNPGEGRKQLDAFGQSCDLVLVDAPCSGSGTWRRNPETRWRLNSERLDALVGLQAELLETASQLVKPGGNLVYAVCSLIDREGSEQIAAFLRANGNFQAERIQLQPGRQQENGLLLTPAHDGSDGFYFARLRKL